MPRLHRGPRQRGFCPRPTGQNPSAGSSPPKSFTQNPIQYDQTNHSLASTCLLRTSGCTARTEHVHTNCGHVAHNRVPFFKPFHEIRAWDESFPWHPCHHHSSLQKMPALVFPFRDRQNEKHECQVPSFHLTPRSIFR